MGKTLKFALISAVVLSGGILISGSLSFATTIAPIQVTISIPQSSLDLKDLDVRDHLNRRVRTTKELDQLRSLFVNRLNQMMLLNLTPQKRATLSLMARTWDGAKSVFKRLKQIWLVQAEMWLKKKESTKKIITITKLNTHNFNYSSDFVRVAFYSRPSLDLLSNIISSTVLLR